MKRFHYFLIFLVSSLIVSCDQPRREPNDIPEPAGFDTPRTVKMDAQPALLSAEESMKTFRLPHGYHLEMVADESMLNEPVAIAWDGNGRMFVCQMETYMQTVDTTNEHTHESRIMLLEDTNDDGKMDKSSVFIDKLMLPRMILAVGNELLVNETDTYAIYAYIDTDNDGKADQKRLVYNPDSKAFGNLEHQRSGLDWNLDNYIYTTVDPVRFRFTNKMLAPDSLAMGSNGQWGLTHDNYGRLYFSRAGAENAGSGFHINPSYGQLEFKDAYDDSTFGAVWPIVKTPDIQEDYAAFVRDTTLNHFTAANGQVIFRGDRLPKTLVGDYLINEPVARIIRRAKVINTKGKRTLKNAYEQEEFISSSDMNFRPVNLYTGPDGCLYIVDMQRGIIQEGTWTGEGSYLRKQILRLGLEKNIGHGRIYRLVYDGLSRDKKPNMLAETPAMLLTYLGHPNGWWRDNAQKEIIVRGDKSVVEDLKEIVKGSRGPLPEKPSELARLHALWTLEGLDAIDRGVILEALNDESAQIRKAAITISERYIRNGNTEIIDELIEHADDPDFDVRIQLVLSLSPDSSRRTKEVVDQIQKNNPDNEMIASVIEVGQRNKEVRQFGSKLGSLDDAGRKSVLNGSAVFKSLCSTCHGMDGKGVATKLAPPLAGNYWQRYMRNKDAMIRILLNGLTGPVEGKSYPENMTAMGMNDDEWIASVLSYVRLDLEVETRFPGPIGKDFLKTIIVTPEEVKKIRAESAGRTKPWTWKELEDL